MNRPIPRVLITGSRGQVGEKLIALAPPGFELALTGRTADPARPSLVPCDLGELEAVRALVREIKPQLIINPAAYTAVDKAEAEAEVATRLNSELPRVLAEEAARLAIPLIHYSTDYVFDGSGTHARDESAPTAPLSVYGRSKLAGERAILASGADAVILRTSWVFSDHGQNFVKTMLNLGRTRKHLRVVADQVGSPTSAQFLAQMTWHVVAHLFQDRQRHTNSLGIFHLSCADETNWHNFALEIFARARALGGELAVEQVDAIATSEYPTPARRPHNSRLDCRRFEKVFATARQDWRSALDETLASLVKA